MNKTNPLICVLMSLVLGAGFFISGNTQASDQASADEPAISATQPGELYLAAADPMADLTEGFDAARKNNKLVLLVMGANWCHDSRALAARLQEEPLSSLVNDNYETLFVDVGYLQKGKEIITHLGIPVYYATPTVLIVDPVSGKVVNNMNRHQWRDAAKISMEESLEYFQLFANTDLSTLRGETEIDPNLQLLLSDIEAFEQLQAGRLYQAYAVLAPMLKAYKDGDEDGFSEATWNEVRDFRYEVPVDMDALRAEARERVAAGETDIHLTYPVYPAFSWDTQ